MKQTKHTPGPWMAEQPNGLHIFDRETFVIKHVRKDGVKPNWNIAEVSRARDARLIAAAPELLEALKTALEFVDSGGLGDGVNAQAKATLEKYLSNAIAKATDGDE